jgi:hypothetical protein
MIAHVTSNICNVVRTAMEIEAIASLFAQWTLYQYAEHPSPPRRMYGPAHAH